MVHCTWLKAMSSLVCLIPESFRTQVHTPAVYSLAIEISPPIKHQFSMAGKTNTKTNTISQTDSRIL